MKVFISSKMTGLKNFGYENFLNKEKELRALGFDVLNPADIGLKYGFDKPYAFYIRRSLQMLLQADAVVCFGDYAHSSGSKFEYIVAKVSGIPIFIEKIPKAIIDIMQVGPLSQTGKS